MLYSPSRLFALIGLATFIASSPLIAKEDEPSPPSLGLSLLKGWTEPWVESDRITNGTVFVDPFTIESADLGRDLNLDLVYVRGLATRRSWAINAQLEWAFSRRFSIELETSYQFLRRKRGDQVDGFQDSEVTPRFLLVESPHFFATLNARLRFPSGRQAAGLGDGQISTLPSLTAWTDLGAGFSLTVQAGLEHGFKLHNTALTYGAALMWSVHTRHPAAHFSKDSKDSKDEREKDTSSGLLTFSAECNCRTVVHSGRQQPEDEETEAGEDDATNSGQAVFGVTYSLTEDLNVRAGYAIPVFRPKGFENGVILGIVLDF
ncbi:hypothetical protein ACXR0O_25835 [Verrucomicrobiota bacterium sgz303538]